MKRALLSFVVVLAFIVSGAGVWSALRSSEPPHVQARTARANAKPMQEMIPLDLPSAQFGVMMKHNDDVARFTAYLQALADASARAAWIAAHTPAPQSPPQASQSAAAPQSGDCYSGSPVPAYIVTRESGGDPNAVNPSSGALGCYQELPSHFAPGGTCSGLSTDLDGQKACAWRLYDAGGLSPWAG